MYTENTVLSRQQNAVKQWKEQTMGTHLTAWMNFKNWVKESQMQKSTYWLCALVYMKGVEKAHVPQGTGSG